MNKNDLVLLGNALQNKNTYSEFVGKEGPLYENLFEYQILGMVDTGKAINTTIDILANMMAYLSENDITYTQISLSPTFSVFVDSSFVDEESGTLLNKNAILDDYVGITFSKGYFYSDRHNKLFAPDVMARFNEDISYASFSDFVVGLNERGFDLKLVSSFDDIRNVIENDGIPFGRVGLSFKRAYTKKK